MTTATKVVILVLVCAVLIPLGWFGYQSFQTGFSAKVEPNALEVYIARKLRHLAVPQAQRDAVNPVPATPGELAKARAHFADHCATCHANDGSGQTAIGRNVYPKAPDMRKAKTQSLTDGELFFIIHNGIRFTAMPAWGKGKPEEDRDSWGLVHFIRHLPKLTPAELAEMKSLNPTTPAERAEAEEFERFLQGEEPSTPKSTDTHHH
jgi:mono/diheme cytochrome c family protein